jgi:adenosylcobinamide-phosphate synthase
MTPIIALVAIVIERVFGYPKILQDMFRHPVQWMGAIIDWMERKTNLPEATQVEKKWAGVFTLCVLLGVVGSLSGLVVGLSRTLPFGWILEGIVASTFLAQTQLGRMVNDVAVKLKITLARGREAVSHIVGRDVSQLDEAEVSRAAIETLAENASDGVIAPLFWLLILGLPGIALYKAINTADSMIGHMSERYRDFGWASAKCDDLVNWVPARITAILFTLAASMTANASPRKALQTVFRDAHKHASPNAGWPETAMAGALGFGLGGKRRYNGEMLDLPQMGDGERSLTPHHINQALTLYWRALITGFCVIAVLSFVILG